MSKYKIQTENGIEFLELNKELNKNDKGFILEDRVAKVDGKATLFKVLDKGDEIEKDDIDETYAIDAIEKNDEKQFVLGRVLIPDRVDAQNDIAKKEEIEKAAHKFMINSHTAGLQHRVYASNTHIVENYIAPTDFELNGETVKKGCWLVGMKVLNDEIWKEIKKGNIKAYSIGGWAKRVPVNDDE